MHGGKQRKDFVQVNLQYVKKVFAQLIEPSMATKWPVQFFNMCCKIVNIESSTSKIDYFGASIEHDFIVTHRTRSS